ncbi:MAG: zinc-binding alcohol dehydrogenase [Hamadaea sp.]|nr:zinc-binding alcohol dehydrogenase [Hamadaea sp.]
MGTGTARAFWVRTPGAGEIREEALPPRGDDDVEVRTLYSGVSRGTETLVFRGEVPPDQYARMRAPFQAGDFPAPVKYGYLSVGVIEAGPDAGTTVFALHPHQTRYVVPRSAVVEVPPGMDPKRAVLAGTVETAVNALWDTPPLVGDRVTVIGAGMVGCGVAAVLAKIPGVDVELVDVDEAKRAVATKIHARFATPAAARTGRDLVYHASATEAGLRTAFDLVRDEGTITELSWYGDREVSLGLGGIFHSGRITLRSSQVGRVAPARRDSRTYGDRLRTALDLLQDPAFDALLGGESAFGDLPEVLPRIAAGDLPMCHVITYADENPGE